MRETEGEVEIQKFWKTAHRSAGNRGYEGRRGGISSARTDIITIINPLMMRDYLSCDEWTRFGGGAARPPKPPRTHLPLRAPPPARADGPPEITFMHPHTDPMLLSTDQQVL